MFALVACCFSVPFGNEKARPGTLTFMAAFYEREPRYVGLGLFAHPCGSPLRATRSGASAARYPVVPDEFVERGSSLGPPNEKQKARHEGGPFVFWLGD